MSSTPKSKQKNYRSPIRGKTKVIFVYTDPKNKAWLKEQLRYMSISAFFDKLLTAARTGHESFDGIVEEVERLPVKKRFSKEASA
jgi:hypothetical protein